jgi:PGAP1-like protein
LTKEIPVRVHDSGTAMMKLTSFYSKVWLVCSLFVFELHAATAFSHGTLQLSRRATFVSEGRFRFKVHQRRHQFLFSSVNGEMDDAVTFSSSLDPPKNETLPVASSSPIIAPSSSRNPQAKRRKRRIAVLVCPAQFCVPADYEALFDVLRRQPLLKEDEEDIEIGTCQVANLPRTEWIKVARQLPTLEFFQAQLPVEPTLRWYFDALEQGLADIFAAEQSNDDVSICLVGHSIGGWVARAYLGGFSLSSSAVHEYAKRRISSFITLGTPHTSPSTALVDQTRGLLAAIEASAACTPQALIENTSGRRNPLEITCVCSEAIRGNFFTTNVEELVAASSYLPLTGRGDGVVGDGIVPLDLAFLEAPAKRLVLKECSLTQQPIRHCHVLPTPWNLIDGYAPSLPLPMEFRSYISEGVVPQWAHCIR